MYAAYNVTSTSDCERNALVVFGSSTAILLIGATVIMVARFVAWHRKQVDADEDSLHELIHSRQMGWFPRQAERILLGKPLFGKILILIRAILYAICAAIYVTNTYRYDKYLCLLTTMRPQYVIELASNLFFLFIFMLKITASKNVLKTWFSLDCLVDYYTILPIIMAPLLGRYHYIFGFLYFTKITKITEAVVLLNLVDQERSIRKLKLISQLLAAWFTFAGIILLLERIGDFWEHREILRDLEFLDCIYFLLVTVATVGYGDIVCTSYLGRLVNIFIIVSALVSITTHISELYELFRFSRQYSGTFNNEYHPRHAVVCGEINYDSVSIFLDAFIHADRGRYDKDVMVVFLSDYFPPIALHFTCRHDPDQRLKALIKRESMNATFLKGSATSHKDLHRVKVQAAEAVIILANMNSVDPAKDDWENIMRVVSIKQLDPKCRIICVLALFENKALMSNIPGWNEGRTDQFDRAICISQLKMGMVSLNCISPGISTFLSNLLVRITVPAARKSNRKLPQWVKNYFEGTKYSLFSVKLSPSFDGMQFKQVVLIANYLLHFPLINAYIFWQKCVYWLADLRIAHMQNPSFSISMRELRVIPLAVQLISCSDSTEQIIVNPGSRLRMKSQQMRAIVLAASFIDAQR
ncbi:Calcium-activated potassium channel [Fasciolopsis buskii]|uniref:Calcium-activated potassium channel n=1 Tax=Fasciolopsis buskii TaxID=27845 RepID=A0A8E0RUA7_9TREM|nr:Calcium-activated potassium channel [Fasciolopsis buski]